MGLEEFDQAIMRSVAGIEKKRSILSGVEKDQVAKHEVRGVVWLVGLLVGSGHFEVSALSLASWRRIRLLSTR